MKNSLLFIATILIFTSVSSQQNVGIGTASPQEKLDVNGGIRIGNTTGNNPGTIRFTGTGAFEGINNALQWSPLGIPSGAIIMAADTGNLLQKGFSLLGKQVADIRLNLGTYPGGWQSSVFTSGGTYFGKTQGVWTGTEALVYYNNFIYRLNTGTNTWTQSSANTVGSFVARFDYSEAWTGTELIIYGGYAGGVALNDGVKYNPTSNTWTAITNAPIHRLFHSAVWTGTEMLVFGGDSVATATGCTGTGFSSNQVYKYNPASNIWTGPVIATGSIPVARNSHVAVWTGTEMLIFGGQRTSNGTCNGFAVYQGDTYSFNPSTNVWTIKATDQPFNFVAGAWNGSKLYIWGTSLINNTGYSKGRVYTLASDSWNYFPNDGGVLGSSNIFALWNGSGFLLCTGPQIPGI